MPKRNKQLKVQNNKRLKVKWLKDVVDNDNDDDDDDMDYQYERFTRVQSSEGASWKEMSRRVSAKVKRKTTIL
ncbi:unnamed protein product [Porites lobata]|uniref:Uncharacterized protein n=1 Tax=Porites lobata TaxID=104759 RepID=A0ABN8NQH1_9CNID|nr:unnamed protein product [Porites lobata]